MLFKPQWDKPSLSAMLLFSESKPADEVYDFMESLNCPCAQLSHTMGMTGNTWWTIFDDNMKMWEKLNLIAREEPRTFGALAIRIRHEMQIEQQSK